MHWGFSCSLATQEETMIFTFEKIIIYYIKLFVNVLPESGVKEQKGLTTYWAND